METAKAVAALRAYDKPITIMEVCGSHTAAIMKGGLRPLLSPSIRLVSGPGCPVCVTPPSYIDRLVDFAFRPGHTVLTFGDLLKVRGNGPSLAEAKAEGASVELVYSPLQAAAMARKQPNRLFAVAAIGFETTAPVHAVLIKQAVESRLANVKVLTALKTMPAALEHICRHETVDAFICPGHVSAIIGAEPYRRLAETYKKPFVIAGFEPEHIIAAVYEIVTQREKGRHEVKNLYASVVTGLPQPKASALLERYFEPGTAYWRGIGEIAGSGLYLREAYRDLDIGSRDLPADDHPAGCRCADVILGRIQPIDCPLFGTACRPEQAVGACMVSPEGACGAWFAHAEATA